ncbi:hypothetical protein D3C73_1511250 [compost metagenome]
MSAEANETYGKKGLAGCPLNKSGSGFIELTFADGFEFNNSSLAAGIVIKVDGVEYSLDHLLQTQAGADDLEQRPYALLL